jgi:tetratricopeptide (TPR) repeat protein
VFKRSFARITAVCLIFMVITSFYIYPCNAWASCPLSKSALLALVAGGVVPENIAFELRSRGLSFVPDMAYSALLTRAGADSRVFAALSSAKSSTSNSSPGDDSPELLRHLANAGHLMRQNAPEVAAKELALALATGPAKSAVGFVMGHLLIDQGETEKALQIYGRILDEDPNFPQVHTRLSFCYYETGDAQSALREAKAALAQNPDDPVAHMNAGVVLQQMRNFDAAKLEFAGVHSQQARLWTCLHEPGRLARRSPRSSRCYCAL